MRLLKNVAMFSLLIGITNLSACSSSEQNSETTQIELASENTNVGQDNEYKQRYTAVVCRQFAVKFSSIFLNHQHNLPIDEPKEMHLQPMIDMYKGNNELVNFMSEVIEEAYKQPIYYPELENNPYILEDTRPDDDKRLDQLVEQFSTEQYEKCLNDLTEYTKTNHEEIFGTAYIRQPT